MLKFYLGKNKRFLFISIILMSLSTFATLYQPTLISNVINGLQEVDELGNITPNMEIIVKNGIWLIALGILGLVTGVLNTFVSARVAQSVGAEIRKDGFSKIQTFAYKDVERFTTSNLVVRLTNDVTQVQNLLMMGMQMIIRIPIMFFGAFVLAVIALPQLWWTIILYILIVLMVLAVAMRRMGPAFGMMQKNIDQVNTVVKENLDGVRTVKSFVTEEKEEVRFDEKVNNLTEQLLKIGKTFSIVVPSFMFVANIMIALGIYLVSGWALDNPELIGEVVSYTTYLMQIMFALVMGGFLMMTIGRAVVSIRRISEILNTNPSMEYGSNQVTGSGEIEFKNVSFTYDGADETTLKNLYFKISAGEKVGIVGATGSGKTTLVNLIPRIYDVDNGEIYIDGKDIKSYQANSLRTNVSIVLQKALLLSGTISDNIKQGKPDATKEEMISAAKKAQAEEFIMKKESQLQGEVLQRGNNFSGGQKQRLSITRGLVSDPKILILDDSTSALDAKSEALVKTTINEELENTTTIIVSQKISSVVDMDKIIVLNEGEIDAIGTHEELVKNSDVYREIYDTQKGKGVETNE